MSRNTWDVIKKSKRFYVKTYRRAGHMLVFSIGINLLLVIAIYYACFSQPEADFYATNGVTAPVELTPMDQPNNTSLPLLANDPESGNENKVIPQ